MGVTLHYRGRLDDVKRLPELRAEVADIAGTLHWPVTELDDDWAEPVTARLGAEPGHIEGNLGLKGLLVKPHPRSELLTLCFDQAGNLRSPMGMLLILDGTLKPEESWVFVKTQFAGPDAHVWLVGLLKYLRKRYISNLEVNDEGGYWDTGDRKELERRMAFIKSKLNSLSASLTAGRLGDLRNVSAEELASRIEQFFKDREGDRY